MKPRQMAAIAREVLDGHDLGDPVGIADALRELWLRAAPPPAPALEPGQKQFVRDWGIADPAFEALGVPVPVLTAIGQEIGRKGRSAVSDYLPLARTLWNAYGREGRVVAAVALGPMELADPEAVVPALYEMARTCAFWEDCDQLAMKALEPVLRRDPETWLGRLAGWVTDDNKWVRRAGLTAIGRLPMKRAAFTARCVAYLAPALGDPDIDVKRALSFALRVSARGEVGPVKQFMLDHRRANDPDSLWVLCDVIRSMTPALVPEFTGLLPVYREWLESADARSRRSVESAIRILEDASTASYR